MGFQSDQISKMARVEIDAELFLVCRLCIDNVGVYQIVPDLGQKIKYCYNIEVEPYDGLSQLICRSCETLLKKFSKAKNKYGDNQLSLRERLQIRAAALQSESDEGAVSSTQHNSDDIDDKENKEVKFNSDASSINSTEADNSSKKKERTKKTYKRLKRPLPDSWERQYDKCLMCRFCNKSCKTRSGMIKHINTHPTLLHKYRTYIDKGCSINLEKADSKPNFCNSKQIVVHNMDKFISSDNNFYYTLYQQKREFDRSNDEVNSLIEPINVSNPDGSPESSDSEPIFKPNKKKRLRIISRSSDETVFLENDNNKKLCNPNTKTTAHSNIRTDNECITVDDSSDSASCKSVNITSNSSNKNSVPPPTQMDYKIIQNIISVVHKKYVKRFESLESNDTSEICTKKDDSSIKHKALSFGRKIINTSSINCIGLLRYLEHHNLEVVWKPRYLAHSKKSDHVQVMIKLKDPEETDAHDSGWTVLEDLRNPVASDTTAMAEINCIENETLNINSNVNTSADLVCIEDSSDETKDASLSDQETLSPSNAISEKELLLKKLLNANPVQNPKQPRKKPNALETQSASFLKKDKTKEKPSLSLPTNETVAETADDVLHMPIITSTISLAPVTNDICQQGVINEETMSTNPNIESNGSNHNVETESVNKSPLVVRNKQWIKVKPVTELMSVRALNTMNKQNVQGNHTPINQSVNSPYQNLSNMVIMNTLSVSQNSNLVYMNQVPKPVVTLSRPEHRMLTQHETSDGELVLMDSVALPYTKTQSPFKYFQTLLKINKIILLEGNEVVPNNFQSLIKFKLVFQQETNVPVILCLSLYCSKTPNTLPQFCIKVRDTHYMDIDITKLSANWQWEILKVYGGDVVTKMLQNAQKVSQTVYDCTKAFVSLLKEIKFQKLP